jgi:hypothetical protein
MRAFKAVVCWSVREPGYPPLPFIICSVWLLGDLYSSFGIRIDCAQYEAEG